MASCMATCKRPNASDHMQSTCKATCKRPHARPCVRPCARDHMQGHVQGTTCTATCKAMCKEPCARPHARDHMQGTCKGPHAWPQARDHMQGTTCMAMCKGISKGHMQATCKFTCKGPKACLVYLQVLVASMRCPGRDLLTNDNIISIFQACFRIGHYQTERSKDMSGDCCAQSKDKHAFLGWCIIHSVSTALEALQSQYVACRVTGPPAFGEIMISITCMLLLYP